jgi:hypothetical protein
VITFFTVTLLASIAGMILLLTLKRYELNSGRVLLGSARPAIGDFFHRKMTWIEYVLPGLVRVGIKGFFAALARLFHAWVAFAAARLERVLERALSRVRHTAAPQKRGAETSAFLREVTEHKKKLQDEHPDRGTVIEE